MTDTVSSHLETIDKLTEYSMQLLCALKVYRSGFANGNSYTHDDMIRKEQEIDQIRLDHQKEIRALEKKLEAAEEETKLVEDFREERENAKTFYEAAMGLYEALEAFDNSVWEKLDEDPETHMEMKALSKAIDDVAGADYEFGDFDD